ncbi:hypothetical protein NPX13_g9593 [Xylaria arbuscula]|uniref:Uncharacterized protein n=1 Tax=Xylaria arbuscula TaxID=114810 RepID=A0A9W8N6E1_9PEZI|nr:hypothetical protein NPX13_g9593 [Xylaria arbuscula]
MGFMSLGNQNTAPTANSSSISTTTTTTNTAGGRGSSSKPQKILAARNKTKPSPTTSTTSSIRNNPDDNSRDQHPRNTNQTRTTRTVWSTARERGQAIIRTSRSPAKLYPKQYPHITTISTTRNNILTTHGSAAATSASSSARPGATTITAPLQTTTPQPSSVPTPALILSPPTPHTTRSPSILDTPLRKTPTPASAKTSSQSQSQLLSQPRPQRLSFTTRRRPAPLNFRDQNVAPVLAPVLKENKNMGHETSLNTSTTANARPQMPSLSATAARGINRAPLTPKIASTSRSLQAQTHAVSTAAGHAPTTTPLPRRTQQRPVSFIATENVSHQALHDDPSTISATAFSPHLNSNVTPRSGSRQNRVDSANSTPTSTPNHDRPDAFPFPSPLAQPDLPRRPMVTFNPVSPERNMPSRQNSTNSRDSKFFHASEAKPTRSTNTSKTASPKNPTFFYANGNGIAPKAPSPATLSPPLSPGLNLSQETKFMYANGMPEVRPAPQPTQSRRSGSAESTTTKGPTVRSPMTQSRPASPSKLPLHSQSSYRNSVGSQSASMSTAAASIARGQVSPPLASSITGLRRPSTATSRSGGHSRSGSLAKIEGAHEPLRPMASPVMGLFPPANLSPTNTPPLTLASIIQAAEDFTENEPEHEDQHMNEDEDDASPEDHSGLQSPTKSTVSSTDPVTELIANARRERKVQDLQIRNASLEAINRTLERQMRKQNAELRRFRRLSRAGHLSLASTTMSSRVASGAMSELDLESLGLSDLSEEDLSIRELEEESFSDTDSVSSDLSASVLAARDAKHSKRDEERLNLDLSKHQQILIDSQKINQSIKRCLDWTEELIHEGKKALEYQVRVSDIRLGGRVLDPLDEEDEGSKLRLTRDTADSEVKPTEGEEEVSENPASWGIEPQDRDSGIEIPRDGGIENNEPEALSN